LSSFGHESVKQAYDSVRNNGDPTNWLLAHYESNEEITLEASGSGGVDELASHLKEDGCQYGFFRVDFEEDGTQRTKFIMLHWAGEGAPVMKKAKMSVHKPNVKACISDFNLELQESDRSQITNAHVLAKLRKINY